jgi:soluble cytochrome b562
MKQWKVLVALSAAAATASLGLTACGGSSGDSASPAPTTKAPEDVLLSNAEVTAGLATLRVAFEDAEQAISSKSSTLKTYPDKLNELWFAVEGRIKTNDSLSYINFEDALAQMVNAANDGKAANAKKALTQFTTTADAYLAKFP